MTASTFTNRWHFIYTGTGSRRPACQLSLIKLLAYRGGLEVFSCLFEVWDVSDPAWPGPSLTTVTERRREAEAAGAGPVCVSRTAESIGLVLTGRDQVRINEPFAFGQNGTLSKPVYVSLLGHCALSFRSDTCAHAPSAWRGGGGQSLLRMWHWKAKGDAGLAVRPESDDGATANCSQIHMVTGWVQGLCFKSLCPVLVTCHTQHVCEAPILLVPGTG